MPYSLELKDLIMRKIIILILPLLPFTSTAQTITLDYIPKDFIVKFHFHNLTFFSDSSSVFAINNYWDETFDSSYSQRIKNLVYKNTINDTAYFDGSFIQFTDTIQYPMYNYWRVWLTLRQLTLTNKVVILDSHGEKVTKIKIKRKGTKRKCWIGKVFINTKTNEELFVYKDIKFCSGLVWDY